MKHFYKINVFISTLLPGSKIPLGFHLQTLQQTTLVNPAEHSITHSTDPFLSAFVKLTKKQPSAPSYISLLVSSLLEVVHFTVERTWIDAQVLYHIDVPPPPTNPHSPNNSLPPTHTYRHGGCLAMRHLIMFRQIRYCTIRLFIHCLLTGSQY